MQSDIYQHYRGEEREFIDLVYSWMDQVDRTYSPYISTFLTPRERMIAEQLLSGRDEFQFRFFGGYEGAERSQACIYPSYYEPSIEDFEMTLYNIKYPIKFGEITHGRILGTFISQGISRERIGDIITDGESWHAVVDSSIGEYLRLHVRKIGNVSVQLEEIDFDDILISNEQWDTQTVIASSLRLDTLLSKVYNFSRQRAKDAVNHGLVKVNFIEMDRPDIEVGLEDIVSLRKYGRFWIQSVDGMTKKDNYRLTVNVLVK